MRITVTTLAATCMLAFSATLHAQQVINVKSAPYLAAGDGVSDDSAEISLAINALNNPANPSVLYFPAGTYVINTSPSALSKITRSGVWVCGDGDASILKRKDPDRPPGGTQWFMSKSALLFFGPDTGGQYPNHIKVSDLAFDANTWPYKDIDQNGQIKDGDEDEAYLTLLEASWCNNVRIVNCRFFSSRLCNRPIFSPTTSPTLQGILARGVSGLWIQDCRSDRMQFKTGAGNSTLTGTGSRGVFVLDNYFNQPSNYAISFVGLDGSTNRSARISGNIIDGIMGVGGVYIGRDSDNEEDITISCIQLCNNQIIGDWDGEDGQDLDPLFGITARTGELTEGWIIVNNVIHPVTPGPSAIGILLKQGNAPYFLGDCLIMNNSISNLQMYGIQTDGAGGPCATPANGRNSSASPRIIGNHVEKTNAGIYARADRNLIMGNTCVGNQTTGLYVYPKIVSIPMIRIIGNEFRNSYPGDTTYCAGIWFRTEPANSGNGFVATSITADVFDNEFSDDQGVHTQKYGVSYRNDGAGIFARYYDNRFNGNSVAPVLPTSPNPPTGSVKRDNAGW